MTAPDTTKVEHGILRIRNQDIPVKTLWIEQSKLQFYIDNPRIYSVVRAGGKVPDQEEIYTELTDQEHVRELKEDIKLNGGLMDPVIVKDGTFEVLEGNSRLAACRWLYNNDNNAPLWGKIKCTLLPKDIPEPLIFAILGQYHIRGKKDWVPYEQAGFLYRRFHFHKEDIPTVADELGIKRAEAQHQIKVFAFMVKHNEAKRDRWSYYDEYIKSSKIKKVRDLYPDFDKLIVSKIRKGEIKRAVDVRDDLPDICDGPPKNLKRFAEGKIGFEQAHSNAMDAGGGNTNYKRLHTFRQWIAKTDTEKNLTDTSEKNIRDRIHFELEKIEKRSKQLASAMAKKS